MSRLEVMADLEQGSEEWRSARAGLVTASVVGRLITLNPVSAIEFDCPDCGSQAGNPCLSKARRKDAALTTIKTIHEPRNVVAQNADLPPVVGIADNDTSRGLILSLAAERITGHVEEMRMTDAMWRGKLDEPLAREKYAEHHAPVTQVGFMVRHFDGYSIGYSPDGLVGDDGLIEIKSRAPKAQVSTVIEDAVPSANYAQLQCGLLVSGRKWLDYVSYAGGMALWTKRVFPDPAWCAAIQAAAEQAETRINDITARYQAAVVGLPMTERTPDYFAEPVI